MSTTLNPPVTNIIFARGYLNGWGSITGTLSYDGVTGVGRVFLLDTYLNKLDNVVSSSGDGTWCFPNLNTSFPFTIVGIDEESPYLQGDISTRVMAE